MIPIVATWHIPAVKPSGHRNFLSFTEGERAKRDLHETLFCLCYLEVDLWSGTEDLLAHSGPWKSEKAVVEQMQSLVVAHFRESKGPRPCIDESQHSRKAQPLDPHVEK